ncbi:MAG: right-handed parallel beta-helix repeat-containing protein [Planctomycetota bacterium]|nr:right-handed parallel beta-helix repeat-containing protein [Planctomycetota bacterium]
MRRFCVIAALVAAALALGAISAQATTYYVSQSSGNDNLTGQAAAPQGANGPWKTLAKASAANYVAGDQILLKCGDTWNEELRPKGNGTPAKPIVIGSYGEGKKPVIDREDYNKDRFGIHLGDQAGYKIVGIEFNRCMTGIYAEYPDGSPTKKFIWIEDCYFHDAMLYQHYEDYPKRKIGLGICFFSYELHNKIVLTDITIKNCVFRKLASAIWTNSPDNFNKNASFVYNFGNMTIEGCLFEEGYQWQLGLRGVAGGAVRDCVTHDIGRGFRSFNGVAGAMFFRCKDWVFEDSEWGFVDIGLGSGDGEAFDFEGNCDNMTMRNCLFHDTDGPGFLVCCYASDGNPNRGIRMENCVLNGKAKRPIGLPRCEIVNTTDWNEVAWKNCRFYLSPGEALMRVMDREKEKRSSFVNCLVKNLGEACGTTNLAAKATASASSQEPGSEAAKAIDKDAATAWKATSANDQWLELAFAGPQTINSFRIREDPSSSVIRYAIERWDEKDSRWASCFNGRAIGSDFVAPIVSRTAKKVRLRIMGTKSGNPAISAFEVYNDTAGWRPVKANGDL